MLFPNSTAIGNRAVPGLTSANGIVASPQTAGPSANPTAGLDTLYYNPLTISTAGNVTHTADNLANGELRRNCNGAARADLFPPPAELIRAFRLQPGNQAVVILVRNTSPTAVNLTLGANGNTLVGTASFTVAQNAVAFYAIRALTSSTVEIAGLGVTAG